MERIFFNKLQFDLLNIFCCTSSKDNDGSFPPKKVRWGIPFHNEDIVFVKGAG